MGNLFSQDGTLRVTSQMNTPFVAPVVNKMIRRRRDTPGTQGTRVPDTPERVGVQGCGSRTGPYVDKLQVDHHYGFDLKTRD